MRTKITFFPVDNGDMTLIQLADPDRTSLLIDIKIRNAADNDNEDTFDVATALRNKLKTDPQGRPYVDGFLLTHPDLDHCSGLRKHFWLGSVDDYEDDKLPLGERRIIIKELWFSPIVFRRKSAQEALVEDAQAFNDEAKRRINLHKRGAGGQIGDALRIFGEGDNGETDGLEAVLFPRGSQFTGVAHRAHQFIKGKLLGPFGTQDTDEDEDMLSKNNSSVIINFELLPNELSQSGFHFLVGGDAEMKVWEKVYDEYASSELEYDLLLAPHHCSWRTLSDMSWSDYGEDAIPSTKALDALSNAKTGATIVASSKHITDEDADPPCIRAKREYDNIIQRCDGLFYCTGEYPSTQSVSPLILEVTSAGLVNASFPATGAEQLTTDKAPRAGKHDR